MTVDYEVLPHVVDLDSAMAADAPVLHEHVVTTGLETASRRPSNVCSRTVIANGDAEAALNAATKRADVDVRVDTSHQGYLEPQATVAEVDSNGFVTVWASTQGQFTTELMTSRILGIPQSKIKVVPMEIGGGFGGKISTHGEPVAAKLAELSRRPSSSSLRARKSFRAEPAQRPACRSRSTLPPNPTANSPRSKASSMLMPAACRA